MSYELVEKFLSLNSIISICENVNISGEINLLYLLDFFHVGNSEFLFSQEHFSRLPERNWLL